MQKDDCVRVRGRWLDDLHDLNRVEVTSARYVLCDLLLGIPGEATAAAGSSFRFDQRQGEYFLSTGARVCDNREVLR
jgi:hypothetical protein